MKKFLIAALSVMMLFTIMSCGGDDEEPTVTPPGEVTVKFNTDGGSTAPADVKLTAGETLGEQFPDDPTKAGFTFEGWFVGETEYTAETVITASVVLKAKWEEVKCACVPDCALKGKGVSTHGGAYCTCKKADNSDGCDHTPECPACTARGVAPYLKLLSQTPKTLPNRTAEAANIVWGSTFAEIAGDLVGTGNTEGGPVYDVAPASAGGFVWITNTMGGGQNALQVLPAGALDTATLDPLKTYRLNFTGRASIATLGGGGRMEYGGGNVNLANGEFTVNTILTEAFIENGLKLFMNIWGADIGGGGAEKGHVFTIDDMIIYTEAAKPITNFAINLPTPLGGVNALESINSTQFTGAVTWNPAPVNGKYVAGQAYAATIVIKAKATEFEAETLENTAAFVINGGDLAQVSYTASSKTLVTAAFPAAIQAPDVVRIDFTSITVRGNSELDEETGLPGVPVGTVSDKTKDGYTYTYSGGYEGNFAKFRITIQDGFSLGSFTTLKFTLQGLQGDVRWKATNLFAAKVDGDDIGLIGKLPQAGAHNVGNTPQYNDGEAEMTIIIDKVKAAGLTGVIEMGIYFHCGPSSAYPGADVVPTKYKFSNFVLEP